MNTWLKKILYGMIPGQCILCSCLTSRHLDLCFACEADLPTITNPCWRCGLVTEQQHELCFSCQARPPPFSHCFSGLAYLPPVDRLINQFKNQQKIITGKTLAQVLVRNYVATHMNFPDYWLPVPLHKSKLKSRGFNQALEIAEVLSDATQVPINNRLCRRIKNTAEQKTLTAKQRRRNMKNVFTLDTKLNGENIGIVDDVVTTTSTVSELSRILLTNGAKQVQIVCLARTPVSRPLLQE